MPRLSVASVALVFSLVASIAQAQQINTNAARGKYWKNGDDSDELRAAFTPAIRALTEELKPFLVADSWGVDTVVNTFEAKEWADWGPVGAAAR